MDENLSVQDKLNLLLDFLEENKDFDYSEINFMVYNHPILSKFNYNSVVLSQLYNKIKGIKRKKTINDKLMHQRDISLYILAQESDKTLRELQELLNSNGFSVSFQQISKICSKFAKKDEKE